MQRLIITLIGSALLLSSLGHTQVHLDGCESVAFDTLNNRYLVNAYFGPGVYQVDEWGIVSAYKMDIGTAYGNCVKNGILYVSTGEDRRMVKGFDLATDEEVMSIEIVEAINYSIDGLTTDTSGYLYVVYTGPGEIFRIDLVDHSYTRWAYLGLTSFTQDVIFDAANNRLLAVGFAFRAPIQQISLPDGIVTTAATNNIGYFDGISIDAEGNVYTGSASGGGQIHKWDNGFVNPPELVDDRFAWPAGLDYNLRDDILAVPDFEGDSTGFLQMRIKANADVTVAWPPFEVNFEGWAQDSVATWMWDFGDDDSSLERNPVHTYTAPGLFDVRLQAVTVADDTLTRQHRHFIASLADTIRGDTVAGAPGETVELTISANNTLPVITMIVPVDYSSTPQVTLDSFSTVGCRTESLPTQEYCHFDMANNRCALRLAGSVVAGAPALYPGDGPIIKLYFTVPSGNYSDITIPIALHGYDTYLPRFDVPRTHYQPATLAGAIAIPSCCVGDRGNADGDAEDLVNIVDLTFLVSYLFGGGPEPICLEEGDMNADGIDEPIVNIVDLTYIVAYLFSGGPQPEPCP